MALDIKITSLPGPTTGRTLQPGDVLSSGSAAPFRAVMVASGEPHLRRLDLAPGAPPASRRASLLRCAYYTDVHLTDHQSPARLEFLERYFGTEPYHHLGPVFRPHELLQPRVAEAMLRTLSGLGPSEISGAPLQWVFCAGDWTDNAQVNELEWAMRLMQGGTLTPNSGGPAYEGTASRAWGDPAYWHPESMEDDYKTLYGYPTIPDLLERAIAPFEAAGVALPWLSCLGNHDAMLLGTSLITPALAPIMVGGEKARALPAALIDNPDLDLSQILELFVRKPEAFLAGPSTAVTPDPARRPSNLQTFVQAHRATPGRPEGHGFSSLGAREGQTYYVVDHPGVRQITLDTVNPGGNWQGSIGARQLAWLEERLIEVHSRYYDAAGTLVRTGHADRLVLISSHHPLRTLINDMVTPGIDCDTPRALAQPVADLIHRFPNVILWINGHTHVHAVRPHLDPAGHTAGFWEITTGSLIEWPCQARELEIVDNGNGTLSIVATLIDHASPVDPAMGEGIWSLAALHRQLAMNEPHHGHHTGKSGQPEDRNVELVIPTPFPAG
jgi:metallophosphoesterase (TIGR03767 family)